MTHPNVKRISNKDMSETAVRCDKKPLVNDTAKSNLLNKATASHTNPIATKTYAFMSFVPWQRFYNHSPDSCREQAFPLIIQVDSSMKPLMSEIAISRHLFTWAVGEVGVVASSN